MVIDLRDAATTPGPVGTRGAGEFPAAVDLQADPGTRNPFAGGLLTVLLVPSTASHEECLAALRRAGVQAWTEHLPAPADETVSVAGVACEEAPSMDAIGDAERHVLAVLEAAGVEVEVRGSGYVGAGTGPGASAHPVS